MVKCMSGMILLLCMGPLKIKCSPGCSLEVNAMHQYKIPLKVSYTLVCFPCSCYFSPCVFDLIWNKNYSGFRQFWSRHSGNGTGLDLQKIQLQKILPEQRILSKSGLIRMSPLYYTDLSVRRTDSELDDNGHWFSFPFKITGSKLRSVCYNQHSSLESWSDSQLQNSYLTSW